MSKRALPAASSSSSAPSAAAAASAPSASASVAAPNKRPRHFHAGPSVRTEDSDQEKQIATPDPSPIRRLHRHALESILGFCSEYGLVHALEVSKEWNGAVRSMRSIGFWFDLNQSGRQLSSLVSSPLARHLGDLHSDFGDEGELPWAIGPTQMSHLAATATELSGLSCTCVLPPEPATLSLPRKLVVVTLTLAASSKVAQIHALFQALNQLPLIESLDFYFESDVPASLNFALLHPPSLQTLTFTVGEGEPLSLTTEQIEVFRSPFFASLDSLQLNQLGAEHWLSLLRAPHRLQWSSTATVPRLLCTVDNSPALVSLSRTLTHLTLRPAYDVHFLSQLRCLESLDLHVRDNDAFTMTAEPFLASVRCPSLVYLSLSAPLTSADMASLLAGLPLLTDLSLHRMSELESLVFMYRCPATQGRLTRLRLNRCRHRDFRLKELLHVLSLSSLTELDLSLSFVEPLDSLTRALLTPPSRILPAMRHFSCIESSASGQDEEEEEHDEED